MALLPPHMMQDILGDPLRLNAFRVEPRDLVRLYFKRDPTRRVHYSRGKHIYTTPWEFYPGSKTPGPSDSVWIVPGTSGE